MKEVIKQYLKLILVFVLIILAVVFVSGTIIHENGNSLSSLWIIMLIAILTVPIFGIVSVKMMTTQQCILC